MEDSLLLDKSLQFIKEGEGDNVIIFSPFFPFNYRLIKNFFNEISLVDTQFIYSTLTKVKNIKSTVYHYENFYKLYSRIINLLSNKKITLVGFGTFANLFIHLAYMHIFKIHSLILFEPDFSYTIFKRLYYSRKKPVLKRKFFLNYYIDYNKKIKFTEEYLENINLENIKYYYDSLVECSNIDKLKDLVEYIPKKIESDTFNKIINKLESKRGKKILKENYAEDSKYYNLKKSEMQLNEIMNLKKIFYNANFITKLSVFWLIMSRESWPLAQILEEYDIPVFNLNNNIYEIFQKKDDKILQILEKEIKK